MGLPTLTVEGITFDANSRLTRTCTEGSPATTLVAWRDMDRVNVGLKGADAPLALAHGDRRGWRWHAARLYSFQVALSGTSLISGGTTTDFLSGMRQNVKACADAFDPEIAHTRDFVASWTDETGAGFTAGCSVIQLEGYQAGPGLAIWTGTLNLTVLGGVWTPDA